MPALCGKSKPAETRRAVPSLRSQAPKNSQVSNPKRKTRGSVGVMLLFFGIWSLCGIWDLELGIFILFPLLRRVDVNQLTEQTNFQLFSIGAFECLGQNTVGAPGHALEQARLRPGEADQPVATVLSRPKHNGMFF